MQIQRRVDIHSLRGLRDCGKAARRASGQRSRRSAVPRHRARAPPAREGLLHARSAASAETKPPSDHRSQHHVASLARLSRRVERRQGVRRLNNAGNRRSLAKRQIADILSEVEPRRLGHAVNRKRSPIAEVDVIQIELEHLVLGGSDIEDDCHELLEDLPSPRPLARLLLDGHFFGQEEVPGQLLRNRARAFQIRPVAEHVGEDRADDSNGIDPGCKVEPPIFDRQNGFDHARWQRRERHLPALDARLDQRGQHGRLHRDARQGLLADRQRFDANDRPTRLRGVRAVAGAGRWKLTIDCLATVAAGARHDRDQGADDRELPRAPVPACVVRTRDRSVDRAVPSARCLSPRRISRGRANTRGSTRSRSPCSRASIMASEADVVIAGQRTNNDKQGCGGNGDIFRFFRVRSREGHDAVARPFVLGNRPGEFR